MEFVEQLFQKKLSVISCGPFLHAVETELVYKIRNFKVVYLNQQSNVSTWAHFW